MSKHEIGMEVYFKAHVYDPPFFPFYEEYRGHKFKVVRFGNEELHEDPDSLVLECITDPSVIVKGNVHKEDVKRA